MKKIICLGLLLLSLSITTSCSSINKTNYQAIKDGMYYSEVVKILGEPNEKKPNIPDMYHNCYYWYDGALTLDEAKAKAKEGKKVYYIGIMTTTSKYLVIGKSAGYVDEKLEYGEIAVNV